MSEKSTFVKSAYSTTPVAKTQMDVMTLLRRYGGTGFGYDLNGDVLTVYFSAPGVGGASLRIAYPVSISRVQERLTAHFKTQRQGAASREQAERVAWRNVYELVDAAFAAAAIGASTVEEAFHAHLVIRTADGAEGRLYDYVETLRSAGGGQLPGAGSFKALPRGKE